jgi:hypothetical protein
MLLILICLAEHKHHNNFSLYFRFAPVADKFSCSSDISGLLSDSDEDAIQKQEQDVAVPQKLVSVEYNFQSDCSYLLYY